MKPRFRRNLGGKPFDGVDPGRAGPLPAGPDHLPDGRGIAREQRFDRTVA
jgi:hypothetical protein